MFARRLVPLFFPLLSLTIACGAEEPSPSPSPAMDLPAPEPAEPPTDTRATFHFTVERDGTKTEVSSIVYTESFATRIEGLPAGAEMTLVARMFTPGSTTRGWTSSVVFKVDEHGVVDTSTMAPLSGSYDGVDPDGVFWSMSEGPMPKGLGTDKMAAYFEARLGDVVVGTTMLKRTAMPENITIETVTEGGLVAEYFLPAGIENRVPVVAFGGSEGGIYGGESYARQVASMGYPALAVAYFGTTGVPAKLEAVPLEYFEKAFAWLDARPETRKGKVVVIGGSRGGELALQLGAVFDNVAGVIAQTPSSYRWSGLGSGKASAWTFGGAAMPFVPSAPLNEPEIVQTPDGRDAYALRAAFERNLASAKPGALEAARILVENTKGSILMIGGDGDQMWPACEFMKRAMSKLTDTGHAATYGDEAVCVADAGHNVGSVGLPTGPTLWSDVGSVIYALGGTPKGNAHAGRIAESKIRAFLARVAR